MCSIYSVRGNKHDIAPKTIPRPPPPSIASNPPTPTTKIRFGLVNITLPQCIKPNTRPGRGQHQLRYHHLQTNLDIYRYSFYPRVIPLWNLLPTQAVLAISPEAFNLAAMPFIRQLQPAASGKSW